MFLLSCSLISQAQNNLNDSITNMDELKLLYVKHPWLTTNNPAALTNIDQRIVDVFLGFEHTGGSFYNYNNPKAIDAISFATEGYSKPNNITFYGKMGYRKSKEHSLNWNDVSFIAEENPFIIADSIGGNYDNEIFNLEGKVASQNASGILKWGLSVSYKVGKKVDQTDPRPRISSMILSARPGITLVHDNWEIGANLLVSRFLEEVDFDVEDHYTNYHYFRFMGFGKYLVLSDDYFSRNYKGWNYGGSLQAQYKNTNWTNLLELQLLSEYERAQEGTINTRFLSGDYSALTLNLTNRIRFLHDNGLNEIKLQGSLTEVKGKWFDQKQVTGGDGTQYWQVYNESIRYKKAIAKAGIQYNMIHQKKDGFTNHILSAGVQFQMDMGNFYPEGYKQDIYNLTGNIGGYKQWQLGKTNLSLNINLGYRYNLQSDLEIDQILLVERVTYPDHYYRSTDNFQLNGFIKFGLPYLFKSKVLPYLAFESRWIKTMDKVPYFDNNAYRLYSVIKMGVSF